MTIRFSHLVAGALVAVLAASCGGSDDAPADSGADNAKTGGAAASQPTADPSDEPMAPISDADQVQANTLYSNLCVTCHGTSGKGDGVAGKGLPVKPRDWTDAAWQASVTNEHLAKTIVEGGAAVGLSPLMPASPQIKGKDGVIAALVQKVRSFKK